MSNKKYIPLCFYLLAVLTACNYSTATSEQQKTRAVLSADEINLGEVKINTLKEVELTLSNTGEVPLTVYRVATSCGCTEVEWDRKPVKPHKTKTIKIKYKDKYPGYIHKTVTIYGNTEQPIVAKLSGELIE